MFRVNLMLADHAEVAGGKLFINGAGWSVTGPLPCPFAIVADIKVPWTEINRKHKVRFELIDADGQPVEVETPEGQKALKIEGEFMVTPNRDAIPGVAVTLPVAINIPPQQIPPGGLYEWKLWIDEHTDENWRLTFSTRPAKVGAQS